MANEKDIKEVKEKIKAMNSKMKGNRELIKECEATGRRSEAKRLRERNKEHRSSIELLKLVWNI